MASLLGDMSEEEIERRIDHGSALQAEERASGVQRECTVQKEMLVS